ncbi:hypothetical protein LT493_44665 [Streptomyces tricolor]|nr:hypothetical protein [Streptomyces tricolor]
MNPANPADRNDDHHLAVQQQPHRAGGDVRAGRLGLRAEELLRPVRGVDRPRHR